MAETALRAVAVAGVLATGLLFGGFAAPAFAQPDDSGGSSQDGGDSGGSDGSGGDDSPGSDTSDGSDDSGGADDGGSGTADPDPTDISGNGTAVPGEVVDPPSVTVDPPSGTADSGRSIGDSIGVSVAESPPPPQQAQKTEYPTSLTVPILQLPSVGEIPMGSWPTVSSLYTTIEIPVLSFDQFLAALRIVTTPAPSPGPAFRTQEESPVVDATTGTTGGGGGGGSEAQVLRAPLVTVPRALTVAGRGAKPTIGAAAGAWVQPGATQPGAAGVQTPVIRGSLQPTPGVASVPADATAPAVPAATTISGQPARLGFPRYMRSPTVTELAMVAVPGVAGLLLLTFGGGMIGYRQANSVRFVRTAGAERFLP